VKRTLKILMVVTLCSVSALVVARPVQAPPPPQLAPLAWLIGNWHCSGEYRDVSLPDGTPITVAHTDTALFHVALGVGNQWIVGQYLETQAALPGQPLTAPISVLDELTVNPFGVNVRTFTDSHTGQLQATFTIDAAGGIDWVGTYTLVPLALPFTEHLTRGAGDTSFDIDSKLDVGAGPVTFQIEHCVLQ
jgi:hypothetical protein